MSKKKKIEDVCVSMDDYMKFNLCNTVHNKMAFSSI